MSFRGKPLLVGQNLRWHHVTIDSTRVISLPLPQVLPDGRHFPLGFKTDFHLVLRALGRGRAGLLMGSDDDADINKGPWTATDDADLREAVSSGASLDEVAAFLCRDPLDVAQRAAALGLKWRHGKLH
jgi:hypothetical protein